MNSYRHPDLDRPSVSLEQLKAIDAVVRRHLPDDVELIDLSVLPASEATKSIAPMAVRVTVRKSGEEDPLRDTGWQYELVQEVRAGWDAADFCLEIDEAGPIR